MQNDHILEAIDQQISKLQRARDLLAASTAVEPEGKRRDRPLGSKGTANRDPASHHAKKAKRTMSPEGKARIAAAQKARWAAQKKADQPVKPTAKKTATKAKAAKKRASPTKKATTFPERQPATEAASDA